jgi:hypothetical protein
MIPALRWMVLSILALHGFFVFPGHTYLQSDTQIYVPMFDRISDPTLFTRELVAQKQHVSLTIYDELAIAGNKVTGIDYEYILGAIQLVTRLAGLYGLYLIGIAFGLSELLALMIPAIVGLGAFINGPAVLTFEYEPVPRAFSVMLILLALGLAMHGRSQPAAIAAGLAFLFHAPAAVPFFAPFLWMSWREKSYRALAILGGSVGLAAVFTFLQAGEVERQSFLATIDPEWEKLQRMRAAYNWLGMWKPWFIQEFLLHGALAGAALWRISRHLSVRARFYAISMTIIGLLSLPLAYILLERYKWLLMVQVQPARSVLYTVLFSLIASTAAGLFALRERRTWWDAPVWFFPPLLVAIHRFFMDWPYPTLKLNYVFLLIAAAVLTAFLLQQRFKYHQLAAAVSVVAFVCLAGWSFFDGTKQVNFDTAVHNRELDDISQWARANTPKDAMFQLPEFTRSLVSGVFRAKAQRALYVDWKIGGQVNYSRDLSLEWHRRMQIADQKDKPLVSWRDQGVNYLILKAATNFPSVPPPMVYRNARYAVYRLDPAR